MVKKQRGVLRVALGVQEWQDVAGRRRKVGEGLPPLHLPGIYSNLTWRVSVAKAHLGHLVFCSIFKGSTLRN
ncbi:unnamed protein product [Ixodes persulcatus]